MTKTAFTFTGQGSQYVGMGRDLYQAFSECREVFDRADEILGFRLSQLCFKGPEEKLTKTDICQPAILVHSAAVLAAMEVNGIRAEAAGAACGLSLGEYTALMFAGVLTFEQAVTLVRKRGQFMQEASEMTPSGMACVLKYSPEKVKEVLGGMDADVSIANLNCPGQVVISAEQNALDKAVEMFRGIKECKIVPLNVAGAFHSAVMGPAKEKLRKEVGATSFLAPRIPVYSNNTGMSSTDPEVLKQNIVEQLVSPVLWEKCVRGMIEDGCGLFYDIGPGRVLAGLNKRISGDICSESYDSLSDFGSV